MSGLSSFNCEILNPDSVDPSLLCPICQELMNHPVSLICGHSACKECMNTLVKRQASRQKNCPLCRAVIADISFKINVPLNAIISKLDIRCTNNGCTWIGAHHEKAGHQDNCQFLERSCPHGCAGTFFVQSLEEHLRDCQFERVTCQHCLDTSPRYMMRTHEKVCIQRPQDCPLGCGEKFRRSYVHLHLQGCPERVVKCRVVGCNCFYKNCMEYVHNQQHQQTHQGLLQMEVERLSCALFERSDSVAVRRTLLRRQCFKWTVKATSFMNTSADIASPLFGFSRFMFMCLWSRTVPNNRLFIQRVFGDGPITLQARFALLKDGNVKIFTTRKPTSLDNGQMTGTTVDFGHFTREQDFIIKVTILIYRHTN